MNSLNTETDADEHHHSYNEIEDIIFVDRKLDYVKNSEAEAESSDIKIDCLINEKDKRSDQIVQQSETPSLIDQPNCDNDDGSSGSSMKHTENRVVVKTSSSTGDDLSLNAEDLLLSSDELAEIIAAQKHQSSTILLDQHEQLPTMEHDYDDVHDADQQLFNFQDPKKTMDVWSQTNDHNENEEVFYREQDTDIASEQDVSIQMQQSVMHSAVCKDNIANLYQEPEAFIKIGSQLAMMGSNCQQQYDNNVESDLTPQNQYNSEADNGVHINATPIVSSFVAFKYCFLACVAIILTLGLLHNTLYIFGDNNDLHQHTNVGDNFAVISNALVANKSNNVISNDRSSLSYPGSYQARKPKVEERTGSKLELDSICNAPFPTNDFLKQLAIIGVETKIEDIYGAGLNALVAKNSNTKISHNDINLSHSGSYQYQHLSKEEWDGSKSALETICQSSTPKNNSPNHLAITEVEMTSNYNFQTFHVGSKTKFSTKNDESVSLSMHLNNFIRCNAINPLNWKITIDAISTFVVFSFILFAKKGISMFKVQKSTKNSKSKQAKSKSKNMKTTPRKKKMYVTYDTSSEHFRKHFMKECNLSNYETRYTKTKLIELLKCKGNKVRTSSSKQELIHQLLFLSYYEYQKQTYRELQLLCRERGLKQTGKKDCVIQRLIEAGP